MSVQPTIRELVVRIEYMTGGGRPIGPTCVAPRDHSQS